MMFLGLENIKVCLHEDEVNGKKKNLVKIKVVILLPYNPAMHSLVFTQRS